MPMIIPLFHLEDLVKKTKTYPTTWFFWDKFLIPQQYFQVELQNIEAVGAIVCHRVSSRAIAC